MCAMRSRACCTSSTARRQGRASIAPRTIAPRHAKPRQRQRQAVWQVTLVPTNQMTATLQAEKGALYQWTLAILIQLLKFNAFDTNSETVRLKGAQRSWHELSAEQACEVLVELLLDPASTRLTAAQRAELAMALPTGRTTVPDLIVKASSAVELGDLYDLYEHTHPYGLGKANAQGFIRRMAIPAEQLGVNLDGLLQHGASPPSALGGCPLAGRPAAGRV